MPTKIVKVKASKRNGKVVKAHTRKVNTTSGAYLLKKDMRGGPPPEQRENFAKSKLDKKDYAFLVKQIKQDDKENNLPKAKTDTQAVRRALRDYYEPFQKSHNAKGLLKKRK